MGCSDSYSLLPEGDGAIVSITLSIPYYSEQYTPFVISPTLCNLTVLYNSAIA